MALALLLHGQKSLFGFENGHMKQKALHKVHVNSAKIWGIKMEIYLTAEVPMGINIDQSGVQRNRHQMTPPSMATLWGAFKKCLVRNWANDLVAALPNFCRCNIHCSGQYKAKMT